jgi:ribosomal protein S18 acetylase RimI-like enzyme
MGITIIKAELTHLPDCCMALENSELGRVYFSAKESAARVIEEGISKGELFVAVDEDSRCLGFIWVVVKGAFHSFPYLHIIAVKEEHRSKGVGKMLLNYLENTIADHSTKLFLVVADFNPKAMKLYQSLGYKEIGVLPDLYREGVHEHLMMKTL